MTISNITSAFRNTGIHPLDRQKLLDKLPVSTLGVNCDNDLPTPAEKDDPFAESRGCTNVSDS